MDPTEFRHKKVRVRVRVVEFSYYISRASPGTAERQTNSERRGAISTALRYAVRHNQSVTSRHGDVTFRLPLVPPSS